MTTYDENLLILEEEVTLDDFRRQPEKYPELKDAVLFLVKYAVHPEEEIVLNPKEPIVAACKIDGREEFMRMLREHEEFKDLSGFYIEHGPKAWRKIASATQERDWKRTTER